MGGGGGAPLRPGQAGHGVVGPGADEDDLVADPHEQHNLLFDEAEAKSPQVAALFADLKAELERLQREYGDDGRYVDPATWPPGTVNGPFPGRQQLGKKTVAEAIAVSPAAGPSSR
jgi:hypothetical protein